MATDLCYRLANLPLLEGFGEVPEQARAAITGLCAEAAAEVTRLRLELVKANARYRADQAQLTNYARMLEIAERDGAGWRAQLKTELAKQAQEQTVLERGGQTPPPEFSKAAEGTPIWQRSH